MHLTQRYAHYTTVISVAALPENIDQNAPKCDIHARLRGTQADPQMCARLLPTHTENSRQLRDLTMPVIS